MQEVEEVWGVWAGQGLQHLHRLQLPARPERGHVGLHAEVLHEELWLGAQRWMREGTSPVSQVNVAAGCHDEHLRCPEWARLGMCVIHGTFMTHTCRESCGVCGFLSPSSKVTNTHQIYIRWLLVNLFFSAGRTNIQWEILLWFFSEQFWLWSIQTTCRYKWKC